jgi:malate synthase
MASTTSTPDWAPSVPGVKITGAWGPRYEEILTADALGFLAELHRRFEAPRRRLLKLRAERQLRFNAGEKPAFLADTAHVRAGDWTVAPIPADLQDRRVEITGPIDRKMVVNALNSGASVYMADFEDACSPFWANIVEGQINLKDRWRDALDFTDPETGKDYALSDNPAVLIVRPRGWQMLEEHILVDGEPAAGALVDFGLYIFHNWRALAKAGTGPYFYLPKLESYLEARLWNDIFVHAQEKLALKIGTVKATVLIETLTSAFEMDEILFELRDHITGLNCGRWDYIFSAIKCLREHADFVLPDRAQVVMGKAFLHAYATLLVKTCHRRKAFAMGGMAAQIPIKDDPEANEEAFAMVRADKEREARDGHDGTWAAHPGLVPVAREVFDRMMPRPNQLDMMPKATITEVDLLERHEGDITEEGVRLNIRVAIQYIEAWLGGRGAVPLYNLMEDAATAEISRAQIWQWLHHKAKTASGERVTVAWVEALIEDEMDKLRRVLGAAAFESGHFADAIEIFEQVALGPDFIDFLTLPAYRKIV